MLLWLRQECRSLLRLALPVFVVCSVVGVGMTGMPYLPNLCASVPICGRHISARRFCVFRVFCGNTLSACSVGAAETAAPPIAAPTELTLAWDVLPQISQIYTDVGASQGVHLSQVHQPNNKCTNRVRSAPTERTCLSALLVQLRQLHPLPDSVRRPIRFRPPSDQIPFAVQSDSVRRPIRFRPLSDDLV